MIERAYIRVICDKCELSVSYPLSPDHELSGRWNNEYLDDLLKEDGWEIVYRRNSNVEHTCPKCVK